jgi:hypothetical protein
MFKLKTLAAAAALAAMAGASQAVVLVVDDFNSPPAFQQVFDPQGGDLVAATGPTIATSPGNVATDRTMTHLMIVPAGANPNGVFSSMFVGTNSIPAGALAMNNGSTVDSTATVSWTLSPIPALAGPVSLFFRVVQSNQGAGGELNVMDFALNGNPLALVSVGNAANLDVYFPLNQTQTDALKLGGNLTMTVNGGEDWDLSLDSFGLSIPEPASLALAGLALIGAGVASRRRKAA